jgi:hypothetical protein
MISIRRKDEEDVKSLLEAVVAVRFQDNLSVWWTRLL